MKIKLGLFDSGIGGLSILRRVIERHGGLECIYLGDLARVPYGSKTSSEIRIIAREVIEWLNKQAVSAVLIGCNTTNSLAFDIVQDCSEAPVFGLIEGAASKMIFENRVGILATPATVGSSAYTKKILEFHPNTFVLEQACPAFVPMIENGQLNSTEIRKIANEYLKPLLEAQVQSIILGCSHYPFLIPYLKELLPANVRLIDPSIAIAEALDPFIQSKKPSPECAFDFSKTRFCVTSDVIGFRSRTMCWLNKCPEVELVSLRSKACVS